MVSFKRYPRWASPKEFVRNSDPTRCSHFSFFFVGKLTVLCYQYPHTKQKKIPQRIQMEPSQPSWWQLKYVLFSPPKLGKMNPFWRAYFSKGLVQPPTIPTGARWAYYVVPSKLPKRYQKPRRSVMWTAIRLMLMEDTFPKGYTLPETNITPENQWLEY